MTLIQLKYIVVVADAGSVSRAAREMYVSQPSMTTLIHRLEQEYGIKVFTRTRKGMEITADGREFLDYAGRIVSMADAMDRRYTAKTAAAG